MQWVGEQMILFKDRVDAGRTLAKELFKYVNRSDILILALPRGGFPVAFEVAKELNVKMDVFIVRKLGVPENEELAMGAIVSRGGRPDLAEKALPYIKAPTLLIVCGEDYQVQKVNQWALDKLKAEKKELKIVPGATHLFEEPGTLEQVANLAGNWFRKYLLETE
jgi:alpha-beta hydrolase superfamily lysophospholipase